MVDFITNILCLKKLNKVFKYLSHINCNNTMNPLLNKMFAKRFGLSADTNLDDYATGVNTCMCGNYNHVACILKGKGKGKAG